MQPLQISQGISTAKLRYKKENKMQIVFMIIITLIAIEFGAHIIYHAKTGKAGLNDPAFEYLKMIKK